MLLRRLSEKDRRAMAHWLDDLLVGPNGGALTVVLNEGGRPIGAVKYRMGVPEEGWLSFDFVAVEPRLRGLGLASEAVRLVEEDAVGRGEAGRFWAGVRRDDGLGLYFWLRLGYRQAQSNESPWPGGSPRDMMAMIRLSENAEPRTGNRSPR